MSPVERLTLATVSGCSFCTAAVFCEARFGPSIAIIRLRALQRQLANLVAERTCCVQWMQKALDQMNVQVHRAVSDLTGTTGLAIVRAIVAGERNPARLAVNRDRRCRKSVEEIAQYLTGNWREEHLFNLASALNSGVGLTNFTTTFTFQVRPGVINPPPLADGFTFTIQGNSLSALGGEGGGLGYFGIRNSVAVKFDLIKDGGNETGLYTDGHFPGTPAPGSGDVVVSLNGTGIDVRNQNPKRVILSYDGTAPTETITDLITSATFTTSCTVDIPSKVVLDSSNLFYLGFSGGMGGLAAIQDLLTWTFQQTDVDIEDTQTAPPP